MLSPVGDQRVGLRTNQLSESHLRIRRLLCRGQEAQRRQQTVPSWLKLRSLVDPAIGLDDQTSIQNTRGGRPPSPHPDQNVKIHVFRRLVSGAHKDP